MPSSYVRGAKNKTKKRGFHCVDCGLVPAENVDRFALKHIGPRIDPDDPRPPICDQAVTLADGHTPDPKPVPVVEPEPAPVPVPVAPVAPEPEPFAGTPEPEEGLSSDDKVELADAVLNRKAAPQPKRKKTKRTRKTK